MRTRLRYSALAVSAALIAAIAAFLWQPITAYLSPPPPDKLTIAISGAYIGTGLVHIAAAKQYFAAEGLDVTLLPHTSGRAALDAVIGNQAELATVGDTPLMFSIGSKVPLSMVATIANAKRSHGIVALRDRGVSMPADLKGKTIGVTIGTDAHFLANVMLANAGIAPSEVKLRNTKSEEMATSLLVGQVDAIATWEPWLSRASATVGANGVAIYPESGFRFGFHLAGRREFVRDHQATLQKLLRALLRAERYIEQEPEKARALVAGASNNDAALVDAVWPSFDLRLMLSQGSLTMLEDQARWAIANRLTDATEVPNFLDSIYLGAMLAVKPQAVSIVR